MKAESAAILRPEQARYLEAIETPRDELLARMEAFAAKHDHPISDPEVASFLAVTAGSAKPARVIEVGTNIGYGAIILARAAGPHSRVLTVEKKAETCAIARGYIAEAKLDDRVTVYEMDAVAFLAELEAPVDYAYIDCVKEDYVTYLDLLLPQMPTGAVLVADNVLWHGLVASQDVPADERDRVDALRNFNAAIVSRRELRGVILPLGDGVAYAVKI